MNHLQKYLVEEFVEDYQEGHLTRREALKRLAGIVGMASAAQLIAACGAPAQPAAQPPTAAASGNPPTDAPVQPQSTAAPTEAPTAVAEQPTATASAPTAAPAVAPPATDEIMAEAVQFSDGTDTLSGYLARPAGDGPYPIVLVCHENRGLTPHIEDVTRRVAAAGYIGLAVDLLARDGGTAQIADQASIPGLLSGAPPERHVQDFSAGLAFVKAQPYARTDSVGMVGFCFGGGVTWLCAAGIAELRAAAPFYGPPPPLEQLPSINAAVLAIYAERDQRINQSIAAVEAAMRQNGKIYQKIIYPGVDHAFHNDTGSRYNAEAAQAAWSETLAWFQRYLA